MKEQFKAYTISGINKKTGKFEKASVAAKTPEDAVSLFSITHKRIVCLDKNGVVVEFNKSKTIDDKIINWLAISVLVFFTSLFVFAFYH